MALRAIMIRAKLDKKKEELENLRAKDADFEKRERELEAAIEEATTEEEQEAVSGQVEIFEEEKKEHEDAKEAVQKEAEGLEKELKDLEEKQSDTKKREERERKEQKEMVRAKFFGMDRQERDAFFASDEVRTFLGHVREIGKAASIQKRGVTGADLTIPTMVLDLIRQNIIEYSKLIRRVRLVSVSGKARQNVMGTIPEAVWTEMCANLNELDFGFNQTEVDGYKVAGVVYICRATLEDSDYNLATEIINALGAAIGIALDKVILYGTGTKMPLGIATRLGQESEPSDYPAASRPWKDLRSSNAVTIASSKHGLDFYKEIVLAGGKAKGKYARGEKFWAMNENTYTTLMVEAMNFNSAGAIVSVQNGKMPVAGGDVVILSDDIIPDNNIVAGYGELYLLAERAGANFDRSDEYRFAEDQVAFKGTARYDGEPVIAEAFVLIGLGSGPVTSAKFTGDTANDATLESIQIAGQTLAPEFDPLKYAYTVSSSGEITDAKVLVMASQTNAKVNITFDGKKFKNGETISVTGGTKKLVVEVTNGQGKMKYTVDIMKK